MSPLTEYQLESGWKLLRFSDLARNISKREDPATTDEKIYVGLEHIEPRHLRVNRFGSPGDVIGQKLKFNAGDIIFGKRRAYQRKAAVANFPGICSAHAMVLRENNEFIFPGFLIHLMHTDVFMNTAIRISEGSLSPTIKWKILAEQKFPVPPKNIQSTLLDSLTKIEEIESSIFAVTSSLNTLLASYKSKHMPIRTKAKQAKIEKIGNFLTESKIPGSTGDVAKKITVKLYGLGAIAKDGASGSVNTKYFLRKPGQFIYSKLDFLNGAFAIIPEELEGYESTTDLPCFDVKDTLHAEWLLHFVDRTEFYESFTHSAKGGRKAKRISPQAFLSCEFPYVDPETQSEHLSAIKKIVTEKHLMEKKQKIMFRLREMLISGVK